MPAEPRSGESQNPPFLFVIPAEPRQRRGPESIARANRYGFRLGGLPALSLRHSGRAAAAARAGIHNHRQWLWIPGSRASPAPRNDESEFTRVGITPHMV